jgi:hypothetical protein
VNLLKKKSNKINENPSSAEKELYSAICQRISAGNEKKKTFGKTMDHEKKMTHQNKVIPGRIKWKNKRMMERKRTATMMNYLKTNTISCGPWNNKREGNAWQWSWSSDNRRNTWEKGLVGGKMDIEKPMEFNFVKEWDELKWQAIEAMKSNANQLTNLMKSPLTPYKERQLKRSSRLKTVGQD